MIIMDNQNKEHLIFIGELILGISVTVRDRSIYIDKLEKITDINLKSILYDILKQRVKFNKEEYNENNSDGDNMNINDNNKNYEYDDQYLYTDNNVLVDN